MLEWLIRPGLKSLCGAQSGYNPTPTAAASSEKALLALRTRTQTHPFVEVKKKKMLTNLTDWYYTKFELLL